MTDDRVYSSNKQNGTTAAAAANHRTPAATANNPPTRFPASTKTTNPYNPMRHHYRPTPTSQNRRKFSRRRCFCLTCFWATLLLIGILLLAAIAAAALYVLYHPRRPAFSVTSVKISTFNLTTTPSDETTHLTTRMNLTLSARNPNKKAIFYYDNPMSITVLSPSVILSNGSYPDSFTSSPDTIFIIHSTVELNSQLLDVDSVNSLKSDLKRKNGLPIKIVIDTIMGVKLEKLKMKKIGIRVNCDGIKGLMPKGKEAALANSANAKCKVDLRIKILRWAF
ncbi:NDR1/HIN1-like protein 13 [Henckelia pumila]|uniref:NDR1/HIN1-like protein 13 n=1 Tax=Henckelia pumila TaxID=405737 RepID=UPI003C6DBC6F